jgi:hypothetical protein
VKTASDGNPASLSARRGKRGAPPNSLQTAEQIAQVLFDAAGTDEINTAAFKPWLQRRRLSGGNYNEKLALLRSYGLIGRGDPKLTETGLSLLRKDRPEEQTEARKQAVLTPGPFGEILQKLTGRPLPSVDDLVHLFVFEHNMVEGLARRAATALSSSAKYAGLVGPDNIVRVEGGHPSIEDDDDEEIEDDDDEIDDDDPEEAAYENPDGASDVEVADGPASASVGPPAESGGEVVHVDSVRGAIAAATSGPRVAISVSLDGYSAIEVVQILKTLGYGST